MHTNCQNEVGAFRAQVDSSKGSQIILFYLSGPNNGPYDEVFLLTKTRIHFAFSFIFIVAVVAAAVKAAAVVVLY